MPINVSTTNQDIEVSTTGQTISATVSGGQGPPGTAALPSATEGQVLTYVSGAWTAASPTGGVSTNDPRLSDAREWSASTISQAEAEAGTATTRRAFTSQRVRQAVSSWWQSIQSVASATFSSITAVDGAGAGPGIEIAGDGITFNDSTIQSTAFTAAAKTKLDGISAGATANATDAQLRDRSTHTGTQTASTISDFAAAVVAAAPPTTNASLLTSGILPDARLSSSIARTSDVTSAVASVVNAAPASLDTLKELADALGNDASFASTVTNSLAAKAPINSPTFTGTVSGVTKAMVGLGNVQNVDATSRASHTGTQPWSTITSTPTTLSGYGITDAQAASPYLDQFASASAAIDGSATSFVYWYDNAYGSVSTSTVTAFGRSLIDDASASVARTTLGLGSLATQSSVAYSSLTGTPSTFAPSAHKSSHATGGADALTASDIGAAATSHAHGNLTSAGLIGSNTASGQIVVTTTGGALATASTISAGSVTGLATVATSGLASDLSGTLADARLSANARQAIDNLFHPFLLAGM